jgi:hypothetical protein
MAKAIMIVIVRQKDLKHKEKTERGSGFIRLPG